MPVVDEILEKIEGLTLLEAADLVKKMEDKFGVSAAAPVAAVAAAPGAPAAEEAAEEKEVDVILDSCGSNKINVLKEVRGITGLGLKEAKELVDNAPKPIKEGVKQEEADEIKKKLEEAGASISVK